MESSARAKRTRSGAKKTGENSEKDGSTTVNTHFPAFDALKGMTSLTKVDQSSKQRLSYFRDSIGVL